jgi:predicted GIY-YIG superfamily endonuclease
VNRKEKWTYETIKEEALKYNYRNDFRASSKSAYNKALKLKILDDVCSHMSKKMNNYTVEDIKLISVNYSNRSVFRKEESSAYRKAYKLGILDDVCSHMEIGKLPNGYWNYNNIKKEALKYKHRHLFKIKCESAYGSARRLGILDDVCSHMETLGSNINRFVYSFEFEDVSVYIGLTYNMDKRYVQHFKDDKSAVYKHCKFFCDKFTYKKLGYYGKDEASIKEGEWVEKYKSSGWRILNKHKTGSLGGSFKWSYDSLYDLALSYTSYKEFREENRGAYEKIRTESWFEILEHLEYSKKPRNYWSNKRLLEEKAKYESLEDFRKHNRTAYDKYRKLGLGK